jgi:hypothetical protein
MSRTLGLSLALLLCINTHAIGCLGEDVLFEDDFTQNDGSWLISQDDASANYVKIEDGHLRLRPPSQTARSARIIALFFPADVDICATGAFTAAKPTDPRSTLGIDFWASGFLDFYYFFVSWNGSAGLSRFNGKSFTPILPAAKTAAFRTGVGEENTLRILAKDGIIECAVTRPQSRCPSACDDPRPMPRRGQGSVPGGVGGGQVGPLSSGIADENGRAEQT